MKNYEKDVLKNEFKEETEKKSRNNEWRKEKKET